MSFRVLFVDDDEVVTQVLTEALRLAPFQVVTAGSGAEALETMRALPVDVVVSDQRMPGMTGSALLALVRAEFPDTMRLIISAEDDLSSAVQAINEAEVYRFLLKPCKTELIADSVIQAFEALEQRRRFGRWKEQQEQQGPVPGSRLDRALEDFQMAFQAIFEGAGPKIYAYESLVRLSDPEITDPARLFGIAEALGRVPEVDLAIRAEIARRIPDAPSEPLIFVNVHPHSLDDDALFSDDDPLVPFASRVVLEITERSSLHSGPELQRKLDTLRSRGYRIALDDLGSGYAGLTSFAQLAPDVVKFDMELIRGIHQDATRSSLVRSMATLCREMGVKTVAEGVETAEECVQVTRLGCDYVQGYYLGRPQFEFLEE